MKLHHKIEIWERSFDGKIYCPICGKEIEECEGMPSYRYCLNTPMCEDTGYSDSEEITFWLSGNSFSRPRGSIISNEDMNILIEKYEIWAGH